MDVLPQSASLGNNLEFHPLSELFPLIEVEDIRRHGQREPIVLYQKQILDGRNRYRACVAAGTDCRFESYEGDDPVAYVVSLNLKRRHLNESQRAMVAAKLANLQLGANQHSEGLPIGRGSNLLNVGERSVARAREVHEHGAPELIRAVEQGTVSVSAAVDISTQPIENQREIVARGEREILRAAQEIRARRAVTRRADRDARLITISNQNSPLLTDRRYPVIYADPPYKYDRPFSDSRAIEEHYPTMDLEEICALAIDQLLISA